MKAITMSNVLTRETRPASSNFKDMVRKNCPITPIKAIRDKIAKWKRVVGHLIFAPTAY